MSEITLHFDNAREASDLTSLSASTLAGIEKQFGVSLTEKDVVRHPLVQKIIRAYHKRRV